MVLDLIALDNTSKVWIYQGDREMRDSELIEAREVLFDFLEKWTAHSQQLYTYGNIFHRRFLCLFVDENHHHASGCSIDSSVHFIEGLGKQMNVDFFDRSNVCYMDEEENIHSVPLAKLKDLHQSGTIDDQTIFFNNLVKTKQDFLTNWTTPLQSCWINRFV